MLYIQYFYIEASYI